MTGSKNDRHTERGIRERLLGGRTNSDEERGGDVDDGDLEALDKAVGEVNRCRAKYRGATTVKAKD